MQIFLIRHPRPQNAEGICYGQLDLDVSAQECAACAQRLRRLNLWPDAARLMSSPLRRAHALAQALHPAPELDARLMEMSFGDWEGKAWNDIPREQLDAWAADIVHFTPPRGESSATLKARALAALAALTTLAPLSALSPTTAAKNKPQENIVLVSHGGVIRTLLGHYLNLPVAEWSQLELTFGGVSLLELRRVETRFGEKQEACGAKQEQKGDGDQTNELSAVLHYLNR
ncbi:MAG: histidine phosphatase family protein [Pseudomonadota bacterium]